MNKKQKIGEFIVMAVFGFVASDMLQYYDIMFSLFSYRYNIPCIMIFRKSFKEAQSLTRYSSKRALWCWETNMCRNRAMVTDFSYVSGKESLL